MLLPLLERAAPLLEPLVTPLIEERGFAAFAFGFGIVFFTSIAAGAAASAKAICSTAIITALFGGVLVGGGPCITAAAISVTAAAIAGGISTYGVSVGWTFEPVGASIGKRVIFEPFLDHHFGISHHYDADTHRILNQTYGNMLDVHNTTIQSVTWFETLPTANHTGGVFENLNMTNGRLITLVDSGVIRTALGQTTHMGLILDSFNEFKITNGTTNPLTLSKRDLNVNWVSFNTYGENMNEANAYLSEIKQDLGGVEADGTQAASINFDTAFAQSESGEYQSKFCLGVGPPGAGLGQYSMIVGEVYMNQWGGIDSVCDSA